MKLSTFLLRKSRWTLVLSIVSGMAGGYSLAGIMRAAHRAITGDAAAMTTEMPLFLAFLLLFLCGSVLSEKLFVELSERLKVEFRRKLARQLLAAELVAVEKTGTGRLWTLVVSDVEAVANYVCYLPNAYVNAAIVTGCYGYMLWLSPRAFVCNAVFAALAGFVYHRLSTYVVHARERSGLVREGLLEHLRYLTYGLRALLLSRAKREDFLTEHLAQSMHASMTSSIRAGILNTLGVRLGESLVLVGLGVQIFVQPRLFDLTNEQLVGLVQATFFSLSPFQTLLGNFSRAIGVRYSLERMQELGIDLYTPAEPFPADTRAPSPLARQFRDLALDEVAFAYEPPAGEERGFSIGPLSLKLSAGEVLFLVGGNGQGKTTVAKVLCGLYRPARGRILVNGRPLDAREHDDYRQLFAAVFADDLLFGHVLGARRDQFERRAQALLRTIRLDHKVGLDDRRFSTTDLSQGQRRRLLLLVALMEDKPVLVFDEWAADQDPYFRRFFYEELLPTLRADGKAVFVISHDDRYYHCADRIEKIDAGRLVAYGAPAPA
jgi:putative ATP-binding cassette transporter